MNVLCKLKENIFSVCCNVIYVIHHQAFKVVFFTSFVSLPFIYCFIIFQRHVKNLQLELFMYCFCTKISVVALCTLRLHIYIHTYFIFLPVYNIPVCLLLSPPPPNFNSFDINGGFLLFVFFRYFFLSLYFPFLWNLGFTFNLRMYLLSLTHLFLM